jgi:CheY-like chemotaxis protein
MKRILVTAAVLLSMASGQVVANAATATGDDTTIKLYLPRWLGAEVVEAPPTTDAEPAGRGETVLVVEDDPDVRALAVALLNSLGYRLVEAATGPSALERLAPTARVDLLVIDLVLPGGMNGRELAAEVKQRYPRIKVLYMSGYTENAIIHHGRLDADATLPRKPFRRAELARKARAALDAG